MTIYNYCIVKMKQMGYGLVRVTEKRKISKVLGWFDSFEKANNARTRITGRVQTIIL